MEIWSSKLEFKRSNFIQKTSYKGVERASKPSNKGMKRLKAEAGEDMVRLEAKIKLNTKLCLYRDSDHRDLKQTVS